MTALVELAQLGRERVARALAALSDEERAALGYVWELWARPNQVHPPPFALTPAKQIWTHWLRMAGRGEGKTRSGAEFIRHRKRRGLSRRSHLVGPTSADVRDVMVEGPSGILAVCPPHERPVYEPSKRKLTWPNGAVTLCFSAEEPERLRGPQCDCYWADELAAWQYPETWDQLMFGFRLQVRGDAPRGVITTTPRPIPLILDLLKNPRVLVSTGTTYDNLDNLAPEFRDAVIAKYEGSRLGRQELLAELLTDIPGALWTLEGIDATRVKPDEVPTLHRIVVGVDPAVSAGEDSNETGIVVVGKTAGREPHFYVLRDASGRMLPLEWAQTVVSLADTMGADRVVAEKNNGGDLVGVTLRVKNPNLPVRLVTATRGKYRRAEPVAALYEQGRVHHVGTFATLEDQMRTFVPGDSDETGSPDRMDALVWAITNLMEVPGAFLV